MTLIEICESIVKLLHHPRVKFIAIRYGTTAAIALELFIYARLLGPQAFGNYALSVQIVGFLLLVGAGSGAGYVYLYYKEKSDDVDYIYTIGSLFQYLSGVLILIVASFFSGSYLIVSSILLLLQIPYLVTEPMLRVRNQFTLSAIGRSSGSAATILVTACVLLLIPQQKINLTSALTTMLIGNFIGYFTYYYWVWKRGYIDLDLPLLLRKVKQLDTLNRYWKEIIYPSAFYIVSSILFVAFTYLDRIFLEAFYLKSSLSVYSLSWQVAQSVLLLLNSLNIISGVRIGESQAKDPTKLIAVADKQLKYSSYAGAGVFLVAVFFSWLLSVTLYRDYEGLLMVASVLSFSYLVCGVVGSIMMFLFFEKKFFEISVIYSLMILMSLTGNIVAIKYELNYIFPIICSGVSLVLANLILFLLYRLEIRKYLISGNSEA
jgi:O-antigen/teichoic acid export membrane protein